MKKTIILTSLLVLAACKKDETIANSQAINTDSVTVSQNKPVASSVTAFRLGTFGFPPEAEGCSCYFSENREELENQNYIYVDDYGNNAFLKINRKQVKIKMNEGDFDPDNFSKTISNDDYTVKINGKKVNELEEVMMFQGTMTVENKNGESVTTPIYGECGC